MTSLSKFVSSTETVFERISAEVVGDPLREFEDAEDPPKPELWFIPLRMLPPIKAMTSAIKMSFKALTPLPRLPIYAFEYIYIGTAVRGLH